jgi:hypothetical protein
MSKVKTPAKKKALSLKRDGRNVCWYNSKASRKLIPRHKQQSHMGERRAINQILGHLKDTAEETDASEADIQVKTESVGRKRKAFKKMPDTPLGIAIKKKLQRRRDESQSQVPANRFQLNSKAERFDTPYNSTLHKRPILERIRSYTSSFSIFGRDKKKSQRYGERQHEFATRWREATLRGAPLLVGFFAEEPQWRERLLRWCDAALATGSDSQKS